MSDPVDPPHELIGYPDPDYPVHLVCPDCRASGVQTLRSSVRALAAHFSQAHREYEGALAMARAYRVYEKRTST